jgi:uncharacterized protein YlxW (UPF0749 family)
MKKLILSVALIAFSFFAINAQVATSEKKVKQKTVQQKSVEQQKLEKQKAEKERLAKEEQANPQANNPNAPVIEFDKLVHDYGTIEQHADGTCEFTFTNTGKEPLILTNVRSS